MAGNVFTPKQEQDEAFSLSVPGKTAEEYKDRKIAELATWNDKEWCAEAITRKDILDFGDEGYLLYGLLPSSECKYYIQEAEKVGLGLIDESKKTYRSSQR